MFFKFAAQNPALLASTTSNTNTINTTNTIVDIDKLPACPACHQNAAHRLYVARDELFGLPGNFQILRCQNCAFTYTFPVPDDLNAYYPETYNFYVLDPRFDQRLRQRLIRARTFPQRASFWDKLKLKLLGFRLVGVPDPRLNGKMLDVGCGNGQQISVFKELGWQLYGIEPSQAAAKIATDFGIKTYVGTFDRVALDEPPAFFDMVRMWHSLEHVPDINASLANVNILLKPGGVLLLGLPNIESLNARLFRGKWLALDPPRHISHFSPRTVRSVLAQHGFELQSVRAYSDQALVGSLEYVYNSWRRRNGSSVFGRNYSQRKAVFYISYLLDNLLSWLGRGDYIEVVAVKRDAKEK